MGSFQQFWKQPQRVWLRKALFQIHLWSGIGAGLYVLLISISGSVLVFRNEVYEITESPLAIVEADGRQRLSPSEIGEAAKRAWPGYDVTQVYEFENNPKRAAEVRIERGSRYKNRMIDPYTGEDLGSAVAMPIRAMAWFEDLHINLFSGKTGRQVNAAGGVLWTLLGLSGIVVWWQGIQNWKRGLWMRMQSGWKRFNWDLHSSLGFWTLLLTLMWGVTGVFAAIPDPFRAAVDYLEPLQRVPPEAPRSPAPGSLGPPASTSPQNASGGSLGQRGKPGGRRRSLFKPRIGDQILRGAYALHFGNFAGIRVKGLWAVLGLVPSLLFVTGAIMWINRVIRRVLVD